MIDLKFVPPVLKWESPCFTSHKQTAACIEIKDSNDEIIRVLSLTGYVVRMYELHKTFYIARVHERTDDGIEIFSESNKRFEEESEALVFCHRMIEDRMIETIEKVSSILSSITEYDPRDLSIMPMIGSMIEEEGSLFYEIEDDELFY